MSASRRGKQVKRCRICHVHPGQRRTQIRTSCIANAKDCARCPDCNSDVIVVVGEDMPAMWAHVMHDETCVRLQRLKALGLAT